MPLIFIYIITYQDLITLGKCYFIVLVKTKNSFKNKTVAITTKQRGDACREYSVALFLNLV